MFSRQHTIVGLQQRAAEEIKGVKEWIIIIKVSNQSNAHAHLYIKQNTFFILGALISLKRSLNRKQIVGESPESLTTYFTP